MASRKVKKASKKKARKAGKKRTSTASKKRPSTAAGSVRKEAVKPAEPAEPRPVGIRRHTGVRRSAESTVERMDRALAAKAYAKQRAGETITARERAAVRRYEAAREEQKRWEYYGTIPARHWRTMSGRADKVRNEQARIHGIPFGGPTIDLPAVVRAWHDFLAANQYKLRADNSDDEAANAAGNGAANADGRESHREADRRFAVAKAALQELRLARARNELVARSDHDRTCVTLTQAFSAVLSRAGIELDRQLATAKRGEVRGIVESYFVGVRRKLSGTGKRGTADKRG